MSPDERGLILDDQLLARVNDSVTLLDFDGNIVASSPSAVAGLGYTVETWIGRDLEGLCHPDDYAAARASLFRLVHGSVGDHVSGDCRVRHADGHWEILEYDAVHVADGNPGIVVTARTVTAQRRDAQLLDGAAAILDRMATRHSLATVLYDVARLVEDHAHDGIAAVLVADESGVLRVGAAPGLPRELFEALDGLGADASDGWIGSAYRRDTPVVVHDVATNDGTVHLSELFERAGVRGLWAQPVDHPEFTAPLGLVAVFYPHRGGPSPHEAPAMDGATLLASLAIERERVASHLDHLADHDLLTGLANRATLTRELDRLLDRPGRGPLATMFLDLDAFNLINDSLGHEAGDQLLRHFANRIGSLLPQRTLFARFGGDEFVVVLDGHDTDGAHDVAGMIAEALREPFRCGDDENVYLTTSIGAAAVPEGEVADADTLLRNADAAMYQAKRRGRGGFEVFDDAMRAEVVERLHAESRLRQALERNEFTLSYQPKVDLRTGRILGAEALLRWNHPDRGLVGPDEVIPWAESTGLIVPLGAWILETAIRDASEWADCSPDEFLLAVNVSARQLAAPVFTNVVGEICDRHDWPAESLVLEITESVMLDDTETNLRALNHLKSSGVRLAVDDFGTGYSSLSYLHRFPIDIVKVDRSFVNKLDGHNGEQALAGAVVAMADALGLVTAAEGIETEGQLRAVRDLGCDWGQGFLFAKPVPPGEITALLRRDPRW